MTYDEKFGMIAAMLLYGGSFVRALADCFAKADADNTQRLLNAFPEYVKEYLDIVKKEVSNDRW